ncbi:MAG: glycosyltransferase family 4 protein [Deltaproteobacteria bacterium]|nr:glycosyltransferase family 4 protein [Deltaproteobacteria bacterium]
MKLAIVLDNNVTKAIVAPFEAVAAASHGIEFVVFIGEKNKSETASITLPKCYLSHKKEVMSALREPVRSIRRLRTNTESRMDFYYNSLADDLRGFDAVYTQDVSRSLYTLASLKEELGFKIMLRWWEVLPYKRLFNAKDRYIGASSLPMVDIFMPATLTAAQALKLEGVPEDRITHVYPGVDTAVFTPPVAAVSKEAFGIPAGKAAVLFAGRLVSHKGIYVLLWAALRLKADGLLDRLVFVMAGGGGKGELQRMAREMGVAAAFHFTGHVPYDRMPELYAACDIFCLPSTMKESIQEQFGYVLAEAMACGRPVVASRVGGIPEVVGGAGLLVTPGDFNDLADKLTSLITNAELRAGLGAAARKRALELFDLAQTTPKWAQAIERLRNLGRA